MPGTAPQHEIAKRVASAVVLAIVALGAVIVSPWSFAVLVIVAGVIVAWEWGKLVRGNGSDLIALVGVRHGRCHRGPRHDGQD